MKTHRVDRLLTAFLMVAFSITVWTSEARANSDDVYEADQQAEILTYSQLMALPSNQRVEYIQGIRQILIDISKTANGRLSDESPETKSKLEAWLKLIDRELQVAVAKKAALCSENEACAKVASKCFSESRRIEYDSGSKTYDCGDRVESTPSRNPMKLTETSDFRRYMEKLYDPGSAAPEQRVRSSSPPIRLMAISGQDAPEAVSPPPTQKNTRPSSSDMGGLGTYISSGEIDIRQHGCISKERTSSISSEISNKLKPCNPATELEIQRKYEVSRSFTNNSLSNAEPAASSTLVLPKFQGVPSVATRGLSDLPPSAEVRTRQESVAVSEAKTSAPLEIVGAEPKSEDYKMVDSGTSESQAAATATTRPAPPVSTANSAAMKLSCAPKIEKCEAPAKFRAEVAQPEQPCVFAGMVSKFDSRNRRCEPVVAFSVGDLSLKCASGQTMCNPLLFGTVNSTTPICIGRGQDATLQCSKLSAPRDAERFFNRDVAGMQNNWDEFRSKLSKVCGSGPSQKFHCNECNILNTRLFELEVRVIGKNVRCTGRTTIETVHQHRREKRARDGKVAK